MLFATLFSYVGLAQKEARPSPADSVSGKIGDANIKINYSSPSVKGRKIWGELVPYNKVWRAGANEATTFQTDKEIKVEGKPLPAGKYAFFAIPGEKEWTIIFNKVANQWGAFNYDASKDVITAIVHPRNSNSMQERLSYGITQQGIVLKWENLEVPVSIK